LTWKLRVTASNRSYFQLVASMPRIGDTEHSLLHTPRVTEIPEPPSKFARRTGDRSERCYPNLTSQVLYGGLLKTPTVMDGVITTGKKNPESGNSGTLAQEIASGYIYRRGILPTPTTQEIAHPASGVSPTGRRLAKREGGTSHSMGLADLAHNKMLPTPRANIVNGLDLSNPNIAKRNNGNLEEAISALLIKGLMPTPTTSSRNCGTAKEREDGVSRRSELNHLVAQECGVTSQLSPLFVEEMMGFPTGWILMPFLKELSAPQEPYPSTVGEPNP
jgi:hypothetical protein